MKFIGDVHGKYTQYQRIIDSCENSIQVGDMGVGFIRHEGPNAGTMISNPPHYAMVRGNHRFIRGNHDNPDVCKNHSQWITDGKVEDDIMFVGGALSIDRDFRIEGYSWWADEELSVNGLYVIVDQIAIYKPRIMVTHECPDQIADLLMNGSKFKDASRTRQAFSSAWEMHKPELWVFGHWHHDYDQVILGTRFICLNELSTIDIDLDDLSIGAIQPWIN